MPPITAHQRALGFQLAQHTRHGFAAGAHPPGQVCLTREMFPPVYRLPEGLGSGVRVRTLEQDHGAWPVEEVDRLGTTWQVYVVLLEVVPWGGG